MPAYFASAARDLRLLRRGRGLLELHPHRVVAEDEHLGVAEAERVEHVAHVVDRRRARAASVNCHCVPPSKSMPRLRPLTANATTEIRISVPESTAQRRECSMNWKCVRSW